MFRPLRARSSRRPSRSARPSHRLPGAARQSTGRVLWGTLPRQGHSRGTNPASPSEPPPPGPRRPVAAGPDSREARASSSGNKAAPASFYCPISMARPGHPGPPDPRAPPRRAGPPDTAAPAQELMADPVMVATGHTYDRVCIERWLAQGNRTCPVTGMRLRHLELTPNFALRNAIQARPGRGRTATGGGRSAVRGSGARRGRARRSGRGRTRSWCRTGRTGPTRPCCTSSRRTTPPTSCRRGAGPRRARARTPRCASRRRATARVRAGPRRDRVGGGGRRPAPVLRVGRQDHPRVGHRVAALRAGAPARPRQARAPGARRAGPASGPPAYPYPDPNLCAGAGGPHAAGAVAGGDRQEALLGQLRLHHQGLVARLAAAAQDADRRARRPPLVRLHCAQREGCLGRASAASA